MIFVNCQLIKIKPHVPNMEICADGLVTVHQQTVMTCSMFIFAQAMLPNLCVVCTLTVNGVLQVVVQVVVPHINAMQRPIFLMIKQLAKLISLQVLVVVTLTANGVHAMQGVEILNTLHNAKLIQLQLFVVLT